MAEIYRADKKYRRKVLAWCFPIVLLLSILIYWKLPLLHEYLKTQTLEQALRFIKTLFLIMFLPLLFPALYFLCLSRRIFKSKCFPPPGMKVIRDTPLLRGKQAIYRGYISFIFALLIILFAIYGGFYIPNMIDKLLG